MEKIHKNINKLKQRQTMTKKIKQHNPNRSISNLNNKQTNNQKHKEYNK